MNLQDLLENKHITKYQLSKISGVPMATVMDIYSGKSDIGHCSAKTIQQLAKALDCTVEYIMELETPASMNSKYDIETGLPVDKEYLECDLPEFLQKSIEKMNVAWSKVDNGEYYLHLDCDFCELQSNINIAEVGSAISSAQAWYLREKYLRIERENLF
jgi:plasmid maintenance system antidote protein VapI